MIVNSEILIGLKPEEKRIFNLLQKKNDMSKSEILLETKMKLTTLNNVMNPLEEEQLIVQKYIGESSGGRKPIIYDINICKFYIIGIDISRLYSQVVITNLKMEILFKEMFYMDESYSPEETVRRIVEIINKAYIDLRLDVIKLLGIGLGTVGPLDIKNGVITSAINFFAPGWSNTPIKVMLEEKLKCPVIIENGANSAVVGEYFYGIGKELQNIAYFNCGVGIRTGTISSGKLIRTINDEEDAFGHMIVDIHGEKCKCGNIGCIEGYSSINAIVKNFSNAIDKRATEVKYKDICIAAEAGNSLAKKVITEAAIIMGTGLVNYINLLNPSLVILSGPLIMNSKLFYEVSIKTALDKLYSDKGKRVTFSRGGYFMENAISIGAAALVIEKYLENAI
ncbi:MAG TPA: ROK family protein [Clostridiaceae bacterium]